MRSIHDIVCEINNSIPLSGEKYGIATPALRGEQVIPAINEKYIGIDDSFPVRIYHKLNGMVSSIRPNTGYGDDIGDHVTAFNMSMIVFNNQLLSKLKPDQMVLFLQVNTPRRVSSDTFKKIAITYNNAILNDAQVFSQEYGSTEYRLKLNQNLIQINYTVEATYLYGCFAKCQEDFINN